MIAACHPTRGSLNGRSLRKLRFSSRFPETPNLIESSLWNIRLDARWHLHPSAHLRHAANHDLDFSSESCKHRPIRLSPYGVVNVTVMSRSNPLNHTRTRPSQAVGSHEGNFTKFGRKGALRLLCKNEMKPWPVAYIQRHARSSCAVFYCSPLLLPTPVALLAKHFMF